MLVERTPRISQTTNEWKSETLAGGWTTRIFGVKMTFFETNNKNFINSWLKSLYFLQFDQMFLFQIQIILSG